MAGYANQTDYEADLLATYLRRGRVSPIARRDVDLALSIYRMPRSRTNYADQKKLDYATAKAAAKGKSDTTLMNMATVAVLNKSIADRKAAAAAARAGRTVAPTAAAPAGAYRPLAVPPPPQPPTHVYSGRLTPTPYGPYPTPAPPAPPKPSYTPRRPRFGTTFRPR